MKTFRFLASVFVAAGFCAWGSGLVAATPSPLDLAAERYVKLALAVGVHDADYVDSYFGPPEWRKEVEAEKLPLPEITQRVESLRTDLDALKPDPGHELLRARREYLVKQTRAMAARLDLLNGKKRSFDEESELMFDAVAPTNTAEHYEAVLADLDRALPGKGSVAERYQEFKKRFAIPPAKIDAVFQAAIKEARVRTAKHIKLPPQESFTVEYVTGKSWSGYNWYKGDFHSLIQVNTELPIFIDRAVDLAAHEGYPGHHVYNVLLEKNLVRDHRWVEFSIYPLFSPQSLIAEGSANYGIEVAFPGDERVAFERDVLFPLAGFDPKEAAEYYRVMGLTKALSFAGNEAARRYLNGEIKADEAAVWLTKYALMEPARAAQRVRFMEQYRSYVINYNLGQRIVHDHVERVAKGDEAKRWKEFERIISRPSWASALK